MDINREPWFSHQRSLWQGENQAKLQSSDSKSMCKWQEPIFQIRIGMFEGKVVYSVCSSHFYGLLLYEEGWGLHLNIAYSNTFIGFV